MKKDRSGQLRVLSREASRRRWQTKLGRGHLVPFDGPGEGYGDDCSPWLGDAELGQLVRVRGLAITEDGIRAA